MLCLVLAKKNLIKNTKKNVGKCKMPIAISVSPFSFALSLRSWKEEMADDKITMDGIIHMQSCTRLSSFIGPLWRRQAFLCIVDPTVYYIQCNECISLKHPIMRRHGNRWRTMPRGAIRRPRRRRRSRRSSRPERTRRRSQS